MHPRLGRSLHVALSGHGRARPGLWAGKHTRQIFESSCSSRNSGSKAVPMFGVHELPLPLLTDTYKAGHFKLYPEAQEMKAYGEFRHGFNKDTEDTRLVFYGIRYIVETYLLRPWTTRDVEQASLFFKSDWESYGLSPSMKKCKKIISELYMAHQGPDHTAYEFPRQLFLDFIQEHNGYFPIKLQALREGSVVHARVPVYQITAKGKYAPLCTYLETLLTMVWYQTTVATLSRRAREIIERAFDQSVDDGRESLLIGSRLHDFGMRGCTGVEQTVLGGVAHLLNFDGSDTMSAAYYAQFHMNDGRPVASSGPGTEHSVMTAWPSERAAMHHTIQTYGQGIYSIVMDSYDYAKALSEALPAVAQEKLKKGGFILLRPDSGDPIEAVIMALEAAEKVFGVDTNKKGFKIPKGCGIIQGDGVDLGLIKEILAAMLERKFSPEAVAFGMGSGLLQRVNRDTMSFATKLNYIRYADGSEQEAMKNPVAGGKSSFPGALAVKKVRGVATVFPQDPALVRESEDLLETVYDCGPVQVDWEDFDTVRNRISTEWRQTPPKADVICEELAKKLEIQLKKFKGQL